MAHRSFTRAAEALHLTNRRSRGRSPPWRPSLRTRLFERLGRSVQMTAAGEVLHRYAQAIVRLAQEAQHAVADIHAGATGRLAVGASSTLATYVLPPLLRRFRGAHPAIEISIHTGASARCW